MFLKSLTNCITLCYTNSVIELTFEWDDEKNKLNQKQHGITFDDAKFVFGEDIQ